MPEQIHLEIAGSIQSVLEDVCSRLAVHDFVSGRNRLDDDLRQYASQLGWYTLFLPEIRGGLDLGAQGIWLLNYELGRHVAPGAQVAMTAALHVLSRGGMSDVQTLISEAVSGRDLFAVPASLELPTGESDAPVRFLGSLEASVGLMPGSNDELLFMDLTGCEKTEVRMWDETRPLFEVVPRSGECLGSVAASWSSLQQALAIAVAADSAGLARGICDRTVKYLKEREQFGQPIGGFQALKHRAANLSARSLVADNAVSHAVGRSDAAGASGAIWAMLAKAEACDAAVEVAGDSVQLHGGVGFTSEYDAHLYLKRARLNQVLLHDSRRTRDRAYADFEQAFACDNTLMEVSL